VFFCVLGGGCFCGPGNEKGGEGKPKGKARGPEPATNGKRQGGVPIIPQGCWGVKKTLKKDRKIEGGGKHTQQGGEDHRPMKEKKKTAY